MCYYRLMILSTVFSKNGIPIRLNSERWLHIITSHIEIDPTDFSLITNAVENPDVILKGDQGELLAVKKRPRKDIFIVVAYKEVSIEDGFVLTAYITTNSRWLFQREVLWSKK